MVVNGNTILIYSLLASVLTTDRQYTLSTEIIGVMPGKIYRITRTSKPVHLREEAQHAHREKGNFNL